MTIIPNLFMGTPGLRWLLLTKSNIGHRFGTYVVDRGVQPRWAMFSLVVKKSKIRRLLSLVSLYINTRRILAAYCAYANPDEEHYNLSGLWFATSLHISQSV